jgi:hypothetical protein
MSAKPRPVLVKCFGCLRWAESIAWGADYRVPAGWSWESSTPLDKRQWCPECTAAMVRRVMRAQLALPLDGDND